MISHSFSERNREVTAVWQNVLQHFGAAIPTSLWVSILPNAKCGDKHPVKYADDRIRTDTGIPHPGLNRMRFPITPHLPTGRGRIRTCASRLLSPTSYLADRWHKPLAHTTILFCCQTETQGFEPWNRIPGLQFSRLLQSATLPNLPHAVSGSRTHMRLRLLLGQVCIPVPP